MSFIFVNKEDEVAVKIYVACSRENPKIVYADIVLEEMRKTYPDLNAESIEEHDFTFRLPSYGDNGEITAKAVELADDGLRLNFSALRINRIITLIKTWSFKDDKGNPIKPTAERIKSLHPIIANMIGLGLEVKLSELNLV